MQIYNIRKKCTDIQNQIVQWREKRHFTDEKCCIMLMQHTSVSNIFII